MNNQEINLRYIPPRQSAALSPTTADGTLVRWKRAVVATRPGKALRAGWHFLLRVRNGLRPRALQRQFLLVERLLLLPVAYVVSLILIVGLKVKVGAKRKSINALHLGAIDYVDDLAEQYPLSFYPIL